MPTFAKTISSKIIHSIYTRNGYDYQLAIVEQDTYSDGTTGDQVILEFGKSFDSRKDAEEFTKTKEYRNIFKVAKTMKTFNP